MDKTNLPMTIRVSDYRSKKILIEIKIKEVQTVAEFLYWALEFGAKYEIRSVPPKFGDYEVVPMSGCTGEYTHGLYWEHGLLKREEGNTHYLIHHGLDGLPAKFVDLLPHDEQMIEVMPLKGGYFTMSLSEWWARMNESGGSLASLGITRRMR